MEPKIPSMDECINKMWYINIYDNIYNGILFNHDKEGHSAIWDDIDGSHEHCAKSNKSDRGRQILYGSMVSPYVESKKSELIGTE